MHRRFVPQHNLLIHLPYWLSWWLGYRRTPPPRRAQYVVWFWSWVGAFCGLSVIMAVFGQAHYFIERHVPLLIASYGASAVLIYGAIDAPLAQPRPLVAGHFIGALIGVAITKLFLHLPPPRFEQLRWLAAALSCATAIVAMQITETTHPPAGATALLPAVDAAFTELGWYYLPVVLLSSALALAVALVINNVRRRYPAYWIVPPKLVPTAPGPGMGAAESTASMDPLALPASFNLF
ncbi:HPP family protein [Auriscalpium vulgare]|uniref:HPP family protein n=1 Tax=Auriscalpium vulgare TaxID=40419 RepID=A0ACB8RTQ7_9AGAM|nr:HPP family protein [Auriscalpium vulgare]